MSSIAANTHALELVDLEVSYGGIRAVKRITLRVEPGQIVALIGANGAGKTSTLKAIVGLVPARGQVRLFGRDVLGTPTHHIVARGVTLVPEGRAIFPGMSVKENLELGSILKRDRAGIEARLTRVLELFPRLGERLDQAGGTLSGGEQQMLAIARALMGRPRLLLLDEPSLGLAPLVARQIFGAIRSLNVQEKLTVFLVEQNAFHALRLAHRGYVMVNGTITLSGTGHGLLARPEVEAAWLHHRFGQIHPFQDGNGRVARALATMIFLRAGFVPLVFYTKLLAFRAGLRQSATDIIRFSHGASSGRKVYRSSFIPGLHDVCVVFEKGA